jgi:hypothetical protein
MQSKKFVHISPDLSNTSRKMNNRMARKSSAVSEKCGCFPPLRQVTIGDSDEEVEKEERKKRTKWSKIVAWR